MAADHDSTVSPAPRKRLDSWKEIADYLRRGLTTVQRWEREEGLPVHRHVHTSGGSVFAYPDDLDNWWLGRELSGGACGAELVASAIDGSPDVPGGAMPLDSPYYIARAADREFGQAIARRTSIVLVKGPRQVGKSSLLARALDGARRSRAAVVFTDMQALGRDDLRSPMALYQALGRSIAEQIKVPSSIETTWNDSDSPNTNFSRYLRALLGGAHHHIVWGLDEVDRLVGMECSADVFGLFRSWHNRRALDPAAPWGRLTLAIAYATEAHLLIADLNQSPFNVGVRVTLEDFEAGETMTLNARHGSPLASPGDVARLMALVGGNPYLLQCAFYEMQQGGSLDVLEAAAHGESGALGEHLHHVRTMVARDPALVEAMGAVLRGEGCPDRERFYRLRSAGLILGTSPADARPRCGLYRQLMPAAT